MKDETPQPHPAAPNVSISAHLCSACRAVFTGEVFGPETGYSLTNGSKYRQTYAPHHTSRHGVDAARGDKCWLCNRLYWVEGRSRSTRPCDGPTEYQLGPIHRRSDISNPPAQVRTGLSLRFRQTEPDAREDAGRTGRNVRGTFELRAIEPCTEEHVAAWAAKLSRSTGSRETFALAKQWLRNCGREHCCVPAGRKTWYPTRVLDVSDEETIRVVYPATQARMRGPYASLSHCWGTKEFPRLMSDNQEMFAQGVGLDSFPPTFRDAIQLTRALGIAYLWIDSYCIIQGSDREAREDWKREVQKMLEVYSNTYVNIGAAGADNPFGGLFLPRDPVNARAIFIRLPSDDSADVGMFRLRKGDVDMHGGPYPEGTCFNAFDDLNRRTLMRRGWVFQEAVLSPRMLFFTDEGILWKCTRTAATEDFPLQQGEALTWNFEFPYWVLTENIDENGEKASAPFLEERWFEALCTYRQKILTYPDRDTFAAIEGIGQAVAKRTHDLYSHGLLGKLLIASLFWEAEDEDSDAVTAPWAPSWHWSSYTGNVCFCHCKSLSRKQQVPQTWSALAYVFMDDNCRGLPSAGGVNSSWPRLHCIGRPLRLITDPDRADFETDPNEYKPGEHELRLGDPNGNCTVLVAIDNRARQVYHSAEFFYLPLIKHQQKPVGYSTMTAKDHVIALVLRKVGPQSFCRVGIGYHDGHAKESLRLAIGRKSPEMIFLE